MWLMAGDMFANEESEYPQQGMKNLLLVIIVNTKKTGYDDIKDVED